MTTKDIARIAGVSQSTVSRALDNSPLISEKTRRRIQQIAEETGFQRNANARSLITQRSSTIALIYPDEGDQLSISQYFHVIHHTLQAAFAADGYDLILAHAQNPVTHQSEIKRLISAQKVDGLLLIDSNLEDTVLDFLHHSTVPCCFLDRYTDSPAANGITRIYADNRLGGYLMTQHLLSSGRKRILCLTAHTDGVDCALRCEGYQQALREAGRPVSTSDILYGDGSFVSGLQLVEQNSDQFRCCDAVFACSDMMAFGVITALRRFGISVPQDVAVGGYDDIPLSHLFEPHLTTIHQPLEQLCTLAYQQMMSLITDPSASPSDIILKPELIIRGSA